MTQAIGLGSQPLQSALVEKTEKSTTATTADSTGSSTTATSLDAANLSGAGSLLAAASASTNDVRADKVSALKSAIDSGTYNVPASAVADKLISNLLE